MRVRLPLGLRSSAAKVLLPMLPLGLRLAETTISGPMLPLGLRSDRCSLAMLPRGLVLTHKLSGAMLPLGLLFGFCRESVD